jgi:hypothetical protein
MATCSAKMSNSFVEYRERGFWSWDGYLEHVLSLLASKIGQSPSEPWLRELRDHWRSQASGAFSGWIHPKLDKYVVSEDRRKVVLALVEGVVEEPGLTREAEETAKLLKGLLLGDITTDASSPLGYMVSGEHPYEWEPPGGAAEGS